MAFQTKEYRADSVVEKTIDILGGVPEMIFKINSSVAGSNPEVKPITRQRVQGWRDRERFPSAIIPYVHKLTRLPMTELLAALNAPMPERAKRKPSKSSKEKASSIAGATDVI